MPSEENKPAKKKRVTKPKPTFVNVDGRDLDVSKMNRLLRATLAQHAGVLTVDNKSVVQYDTENPLGGKTLVPSSQSPICGACGLFERGAKHPFLAYTGSKTPLITIIVDSVSPQEDSADEMAAGGQAEFFKKFIAAHEDVTGVSVDDVRFASITRCASRIKGKPVNYGSKGNHCRLFLVQDLMRHPPGLVMAIGTQVLGLLSHKSNAQDWGGKVLTWRGWPDDWLSDPSFALLPEAVPGNTKVIPYGHPLFGPPPGVSARRPLYPLQALRLVRATQNQALFERWAEQVLSGIRLAKAKYQPLNYNLPHYRILTDPILVQDELDFITRHPGLLVTYDTETTGLRPWMGQKIVFMMFRYDHPDTGEKVAFGFPWDYPESDLVGHVAALSPHVLRALCASTLTGHNLTFDALFTTATMGSAIEDAATDANGTVREEWRAAQRRLNSLADACRYDTMHMSYCFLQQRGSLGLEHLAYKHVPHLAGYEEEMTILIELLRDKLHPEHGGHYAMCPRDKWETHLKPYVMGDVEVAHIARDALQAKLDKSKTYKFPLANPNRPGSFRYFTPPNRAWIYENILSPAARLLTKVMGRGMRVDEKTLVQLQKEMPLDLIKHYGEIATMTPDVAAWCEQQSALDEHRNDVDKHWELDLEKKDHIKSILFTVLGLPPQRMTKAGKRLYGDESAHWLDRIKAAKLAEMPSISDEMLRTEIWDERLKYAAVDKFTLNNMAVSHPEVRPLQEYRKLHKLYTTYVRPLGGFQKVGMGREPDTVMLNGRPVPESLSQHCCPDLMVHAQFNLVGTRGGRLSSRAPNLQNIAKRGDVKRMYVSRFGSVGCLYGSDMSQVELRLLAAACGDPTMVQAYADNLDLHSLTASKIYKIPYECFQKEHFKKLQESGKKDAAKDLEMKRGVGKCVDPDTLISVNGKIVRIGSLHAGRDDDTYYDVSNAFVQTPNNDEPIHKFYCSGVRKRLLICAHNGLIVCSHDHRFMLKDGSLARAEDLKKGTILADSTRLKCSTDTLRIPFNPVAVSAPTGTFEIRVTDDLAYFLGLFYGDGCARENYASITTGGSKDFFEWQDIVADAARRVGFEPNIRRTLWSGTKESRKLGRITGSNGDVVFGSTRVMDILLQLGAVIAKNTGRRTLRIPDWMFNAPNSAKISFLAGLIDTDGYVSKRDGYARVCTKSWKLAQDVLVLAASIGIKCSMFPSWNKPYEKYYYIVSFSTSAASAFKEALRHPSKKSNLREPLKKLTTYYHNVVKLVMEIDDGLLVDISIPNPHIHVPNGLASHQTCNFLTGYGGGAFGLQNTLANNSVYLPIEECERIIDSFFAAYPALREHISVYKKFIMDTGAAVSIFGRLRVFDEVGSEDKEAVAKAMRAGYNHLIQSTASDMMLVCMTVIETLMRGENLDSILVSTVHDSLLIDALRSELPQIHEIVGYVMNNLPEVFKACFGADYDTSWMTLVPFAGDSDVGLNYLDMRGIGPNPDWDKLLDEKN